MLLTALKHLASLPNPEFYEKERLRFSTWKIPRFIRCYRETIDQLLLPRGLQEKAARVVADAGSRLDICSDLSSGEPIDIHLPPLFAPNNRRRPTPWRATTWACWSRHPVRARRSSAAPLWHSTKSRLL